MLPKKHYISNLNVLTTIGNKTNTIDMETTTIKKTREVSLENDELVFTFLENDIQLEVVTLQAGPNYISDSIFSGEYPTEGEIEKALNHIEYAFTKNKKKLKNSGEVLICKILGFAEILGIDKSQTVTREAVDEVFDKYIDCAYGEPEGTLGIYYTVTKLSTLIIIRSVLFYLGFESIEIVR